MKVIRFVICMINEGYEASLELHKIYGVTSPLDNDPEEYLRIIDESGEDYLYPANWFEEVALGHIIEGRLLEAIAA
ncbi:MAG: hypothetical protein KF855_16735 [Acidobacteria bacterium]|nr:hypothetical protein [Acidobacteriota bacterium]